MRWQHATGSFILSDSPILMGILNVTPDSFSDGGCFFEPDLAVEHGLKLVTDGATILDIGGESTRPGAKPLSVEEEVGRVLPVIEGLLRENPNLVISIDSYKAETARQALEAGASIVNDVGGLDWDEGMVDVLIQSKAGYIGMHSRGKPEVMQKDPRYTHVVEEVRAFLSALQDKVQLAGIDKDRLALDVGIGFGKTAGHNMELLRAADVWWSLQRPMVWGVSKKSFISRILGVEERMAGAMAVHARLILSRRPQIWRIHEVREMKQFLEMWNLLA